MIFQTQFTSITGWDTYGGATIALSNGSLKLTTFATEWAGTYYNLGSISSGTKLIYKVLVKGDANSAGKFAQAVIEQVDQSITQKSVPVKLSSTSWQEIWVTRKISATGNVSIHVQGYDASNSNIYISNITVDEYSNPTMTISGRYILKNNTPIAFRGINYMNIPIGGDSNVSPAHEAKQVRYDMEDIKALGMNCVRMYYSSYDRQEYYAMLDECYRNGIDVILWLWIPVNTDYSVATGGTNRTSEINNFGTVVTNTMDHPAIIGYGHGNEVNYALGSTSLAELYTLLNSSIANAKTIDSTKFYTHANGEVADIKRAGHNAASIDVWGINIYRGRSFGSLIDEIVSMSNKPIIISEYGYDRYASGEDESGQSSRDLPLIKEAECLIPYIAGHFIFSWRDEWWKATDAWTHNSTGISNSTDDRDGQFNEEWWGFTEAPSSGSGSSATKNQVYTDYQNIYGSTSVAFSKRRRVF